MSRKSSPDAGEGTLMQKTGNHASQRTTSVCTVPPHDIERDFRQVGEVTNEHGVYDHGRIITL
jgi:hypothetical protein